MNAVSHIAYRPATREDWPAIRTLLKSCDLPLAGAEEYIESFLVATVSARIVGCAAIEQHGDAALLRSCAVNAGHRGTGLGTALTQRAIDLARRRGVHQLILLTATAADFFPRFGFTRIAREDVFSAIRNSAEFRGACPASACALQLTFSYAPPSAAAQYPTAPDPITG